MSVLARLFGPTGDVRSASVSDVLAGRATLSAAAVHVSPESALRKVAVMAAVNLITATVSTMPLDVLTGSGLDKREVNPPRLFDDPEGDGYGLPDFLSKALFSALLRGDVFGYIAGRDTLGYPTVVQLQHPDAVMVDTDRVTGRLKWKFNGKDVPADRVWHWRPHPVIGSVRGLSPVGLHATTIGLGLAAEKYGADFFAEGGHPTALLSAESKLNDEQAKTVKARVLNAIRGTREPLLLPAGIKYQALQINPAESAFLDTQRYTSAECARIFGPGMAELLGYESGASNTYTNMEQRGLHLLTFALDPWITRLERLLSAWLPRPRYVRFNRAALLRSATLDRYRAHDIAIRSGFLTVNEARALEERPPVPWGDEPGAPNEKAEEPTEPATPEGANP